MGRRTIVSGVLAIVGLSNAGCLVNQYSGDPLTRTDQLLNQSEDLRQLGKDWRRIWFNDQPSHLTPEHVDGGIMGR